MLSEQVEQQHIHTAHTCEMLEIKESDRLSMGRSPAMGKLRTLLCSAHTPRGHGDKLESKNFKHAAIIAGVRYTADYKSLPLTERAFLCST